MRRLSFTVLGLILLPGVAYSLKWPVENVETSNTLISPAVGGQVLAANSQPDRGVIQKGDISLLQLAKHRLSVNGSSTETGAASIGAGSISATFDAQGLSALSTYLSQHYPDIVAQLGSARPFTLFAPNNAAMMNSSTLSATNDTRDIWALHMMVGKHSMADLQQMSSTMPLSTMLNDPKYMRYSRKLQNTTQTILLGANISSPTSGQLWSGLPTQAANIVQGDIECSNGYIHIIDQVMDLPPNNDNAIHTMSQTAELFNVITKLNMTFNSLRFCGQTLFAPSNEGINTFLARSNSSSNIVSQLNTHIIPGMWYSANLTNGQKLDLTHGGTVNIVISPDGSWTVNGLNVLVPNVMTRYGIIHVVDGVFAPLAQNVGDNATVNGVVGKSEPVKSSAIRVSIAILLAALPMLVATLHY